MVQKSDSGTPPEGPRDPFAPPPKDAPDRPWQPRQHPVHPGERGWANEDPPQHNGQGGPDGQGGQDGEHGSPADGDGQHRPPRPVVPPPHPWSPGYQGGPPSNPGYGPQQPRFDPSDPVQRRARYALLSGMWGIFFLILDIPYVTLALASLALYWSISSLRGTAKTPVSALNSGGSASASPQAGPNGTGAPVPPAPSYAQGYAPAYPLKPQLPAALGGLIASVVGLSLVAVVFGVQLYYKNYYDCQSNALTKSVYDQCATSVHPEPPEWLRKLGGDN
ncbi:hypothetical protein ACEZDB_21175 [Streptacidiphilus sp. N1-3]|uniref:Integral membrane protein n=1 Tax=Streptacidiphilus alkalitolerans TaxID=3342712 RepID=A0ABV6X4F5_9ACTN